MTISDFSFQINNFSTVNFSGAQQSRQESTQQLSPEEQKEVEELKKRDAEVRRHEQAHLAAAGSLARSGPQYEYVVGPDGKRYAVSGEVQIDTSDVRDDPEATIKKAQKIKKAALAPDHPSSQDTRIAAEATRMESEARRELAQEKTEGTQLYNREGQAVSNSTSATVVDLIF